jgi:hypothetical protein
MPEAWLSSGLGVSGMGGMQKADSGSGMESSLARTSFEA